MVSHVSCCSDGIVDVELSGSVLYRSCGDSLAYGIAMVVRVQVLSA